MNLAGCRSPRNDVGSISRDEPTEHHLPREVDSEALGINTWDTTMEALRNERRKCELTRVWSVSSSAVPEPGRHSLGLGPGTGCISSLKRY
jgi:hypothetical protein